MTTPSNGQRPSRDLTPNLHESFEIAEQAASRATEPIKRGLRWNSILTGGFITGLGAFLLWSLTLLVSVQSAQASDKEQIKVNTAEIAQLKKSHEELRTDLAVVQRSTIRIETMMEMSLRDRGVQPPPKVDAGIP